MWEYWEAKEHLKSCFELDSESSLKALNESDLEELWNLHE
jgi:hypothetical protein